MNTDEPFDLARNRLALGCMILMAVLALYALIDGVLLPGDHYAATTPYLGLAATGLLMTAVAVAVLRRAAIPASESAGLAILLGVCMALAASPGILRLNALTDTDGGRHYMYTLTANGTLEPVKDDLPVLKQPIDAGFWRAQTVGSRWRFEMRKGMFGFWQYNSRPLMDDIRLYYGNN